MTGPFTSYVLFVLFVFVSIPVTSNFSAPARFLSENAVALSMWGWNRMFCFPIHWYRSEIP